MRRRLRRVVAAPAAVAATAMTTGCWVTGECSGFAIDFAADAHGQDSPTAAVEWFAEHGSASVPGSGWQQIGRDDGGVRLRSGTATVHVMRLPDGTWVVDSGSTC